MSKTAADVQTFVGIPRLLFEEFSAKYGTGAVGEQDFRDSLIRPLNKSPNGDEGVYAGLLFQDASFSQRRLPRLELLSAMPRTVDDLALGNVFRPMALLTLRIVVVDATETINPHWQLQSRIHIDGIDVLQSTRRMPVVQELVARFVELTAGYESQLFVEKVNAA